MTGYIRKINYYETDKMGVTHHSNYIRFMEEARIDFFDRLGLSYEKLVAEGLNSPIIGIECDYKKFTTFGDEIIINVSIDEFKGVKLVVSYEMINNKTGELIFKGKSKHCFVSKDGRFIVLKKEFPDYDKKLKGLIKVKD